ncbi:MAG: GGDEF domain-containing protein, partial [Agathobacter sp.]|nr:GGDEF domain-containing protein [Agathobacter sp.]
MSVFNRNETLISNEILERGELQLGLMKMMAEQSHDKFLEYYRDKDTIILSEIQDGRFHVLETVEGFISRENMVLNRIYEKDQDLYRKEIQKSLAQARNSVFDVRYIVPDFGPRWYRMFLMSVSDENGYVTKFVARMSNIQEQKLAQENMRNQAERDLLSGVYNHATYERVCAELADRTDNGLLYLMVDIDSFKQINDTHGHHAGDQIIQFVGTTLETLIKGKGYAGRIGGDEFSVCFYDIFSKEEAVSLCVSIKSALGQHLNTVPFTVSIGATMSDGRKMTFEELYFEADEAVYFAKDNGKNQIVFKDEIQKKKQERIRETKSEYALTEEEIALDQKMQYVAIVEPVQKKLLYMNEAGRDALGISIEDVQNMHCYQ